MVSVGNTSNNSVFSTGKIDMAMSFVHPLILRLLTGMLIFLLGIVIGKFLERMLLKIFYLLNFNKLIHKIFRVNAHFDTVVARMAFYAIVLSALFMALNQMGITRTFIIILISFLVPILILFFMFGINDIIVNFFAGIIMTLKMDLSTNEYIIIKDKQRKIEGRIIEKTATNIRLEANTDERVFVPYMALLRSSVLRRSEFGNGKKNRSRSRKSR
jgi:small-conductance mechanosensitive channel